MNNLCIIIAITHNAYSLRKIPLSLKEVLLNVNYNKNNIKESSSLILNGVIKGKYKSLTNNLQ